MMDCEELISVDRQQAL